MIHKCIGDSTYPSIMLLINTKSYSCCTRPAMERILMVKMTPSQNRHFQNSLNFSSVRISVSQIFPIILVWLLPIWPGSVELEPLRLRVFALCHDDQPKWQQVEYKALLQEWLWMLQRFPSWDTSTFHFLTIVVDAHERLLANPFFGSHSFLTITFGLVLVRAKRLLALRRMTKGQKI